MNKAFFLDRDGVINAEVDYLFEPDKVVILPGVVPALKRMREHGFLAVVVTNQSGVARGMYAEKDVHAVHERIRELLAAEGLLLKNHVDCGSLLYDAEGQSVHSGASGPGCCAAVLCGHLLPRLERRGQRRVLFLATGALMSQTTFLQKESIPAISHLVELAAPEEQNGGNT